MVGELLLKHGADPNWVIEKKGGLTLLHYFLALKVKMNKAQRQLNYDIVRFLLEHGADPRQLTLDDRSCEDLLRHHCNREQLLQLLAVHREKPLPNQPEPKTIKKIDPNFFVVEPKK